MSTVLTVEIEPTQSVPLPFDTTKEEGGSLLEQLAVAGKTAELKEALGAELFYDDLDAPAREAELLQQVTSTGKYKAALKLPGVALAAGAFLKSYGHELGTDIGVLRAAVKNKLFEIANCGDPRFELKALELLGKTSDIALFTERSEINVNFNSAADLEKAIKERVKRLLNAQVVEVVPLSIEELDTELSISDVPAEAGEENEKTFRV